MESSKVESSQMSRARRVKQDAERKAAAQLERERDTQIRVLDRGEDRTPLPLLKQAEDGGAKGVVRRGADKKGAGASTNTAGDASSSQQESSQMESSQNSETNSASTVEEEESGIQGSDGSHSLERSSFSQSVDVRRSEGTTASDSRTGGGKGAAKPSKEKEERVVEKVKEWTADEKRAWLHSEVTVTLRETPVIMLYTHQDEVVCSESIEEVKDVINKNEKYAAMCELRRKDEGTKFQERGMTTLANPKKAIHCEIHPPATKPSGGQHVTPWKLHDAFLKLAEEELELDDAAKIGDAADAAEAGGGDDAEVADGGEADDAAGGDGSQAATKKSSAWLYSESLLPSLLIMERVVVQNMVEDLQLAYRGLQMDALRDHIPAEKKVLASAANQRNKRDAFGYRSTTEGEEDGTTKRSDVQHGGVEGSGGDLEEEGSHDFSAAGSLGGKAGTRHGVSSPTSGGPQSDGSPLGSPAGSMSGGAARSKMKVLWKYGNELTAGKNVSCMCWNRKNPDILAAGYGEYGIPHPDKKYSGLVCCWSLKNPLAPERVIQLESEAGVSALSFSSQHPSLLAVGNTDGTLALYDVRKHGNHPALKTTVSTGQHTGTIWEVKWVERGKGRGENLISISADGRVLEWSIKKGLERNAPDLMKLKRMPNKTQEPHNARVGKGGASTTKEALLSRQSGGMCFDMNPKELITYVVGTEDGTLHKCSKSQSENYILDYKPHEEPVYRIRWSPYASQYFLTCSADWTSRLYNVDKPDPLITLDSNKQDAVHDVAWSTTNATMFASATAHGRVDIWDIADPLVPRHSLELENRSLNCILFAEQESPVLVVGDNAGEITVIKLQGLEYERGGLTAQDQEDRFQEVVRKVSS